MVYDTTMRCYTVYTFATILLGLCITCIHSAPLAQQQQPDANGIEFSKSKTYSYTNINGAEHTKEQLEEKVLEPESHRVIANLKENTEKSKPSAAAKPETHFRASVDIPEKGIHKEISNDDQNDKRELKDNNFQLSEDHVVQDKNVALDDGQETLEPVKHYEPLQFTPKDLAVYLFQKGETDEFQTLLNEMVESEEVSPEEAEEYEKAVMEELLKLQEAQNEDNAEDLKDLYPQVLGEGSRSSYPLYNGAQGSSDVFPLYRYGVGLNPEGAGDQSVVNNYMNYLANMPVSMDQMIADWIKQAIVSGDRNAEEILADIMEYVSRDNDPNDEEQVKAILGEMFAEKFIESFSPKYEPQYGKENGKQNPTFIETVGHAQTKSQPQHASDNTESDKKTNGLKTEQQTNDQEKTSEVKSKTDELETELKM